MTSLAAQSPEPSRHRGMEPVLFIVADDAESEDEFYVLDPTAGSDFAPESSSVAPDSAGRGVARQSRTGADIESSDADLA